MKTAELIEMLSEGKNHFTVTEKQINWLIGVSRKEGLFSDSGHGQGIISLPNLKRFKIKQCSVFASCGSYVGSRKVEKWKISLHYRIKFCDTGIIEFRDCDEVNRILESGVHKFNII